MFTAKLSISPLKTHSAVMHAAGAAAYADGYPWFSCFAFAAAGAGSSDACAVMTAAMDYLDGWISAADSDDKIHAPKWMRDLPSTWESV